jgi:hypothetical protein
MLGGGHTSPPGRIWFDPAHRFLAHRVVSLPCNNTSAIGGTAGSGKPPAIYVDLHPETKFATGAELRNGRQLGDHERAPRFTSDTAASTGKSERAVQRDAERGEKISPEILDKIAGTDRARICERDSGSTGSAGDDQRSKGPALHVSRGGHGRRRLHRARTRTVVAGRILSLKRHIAWLSGRE